MNSKRPTVSPEVIAAMIEATPERVRRRLDRTPNAAASWNWQASEAAWSVDTGGETVTLPHGHVMSVQQLICTCLLSPKCFHVLACLTHLEVAIVESLQAPPSEQVEQASANEGEEFVEPDEKQRHAAGDLVNSIAQLVRVGVANAGVVVQSSLLRAVHQCRADGLHRLAALGLRVITGVSEFRSRSPASDPAQLAEDIADILETSRHVQSQKAIAGFWIGTARRKQMPVRPRNLHGLFAEPIITRSGFSGAAAYFLGEDERIYTASDVRPGDAQHAHDAYLGGIEIGSMIQPVKLLARGLYLGSELTASGDGRLGRGKGIKIVEQGQSSWQVEAIQKRFGRPLLDQWNTVYEQADLLAEARPAGWDLVFLKGKVLGAAGPELLFDSNSDAQPIRLAIENDSEALHYRENLRMLSHAPGLQLQVIARVNMQEPRIVSPLAVAPLEGDTNKDQPRLEIPESFAGRICLGFDEIQRHFLRNAQVSAVVLSAQSLQHEMANPLIALRRRWIAGMLSGLVSQRTSNTNMLKAETATLNRTGFTTGAALLDALSSATSDTDPSSIDTFLAVAIYLRKCSYELGRSRANLGS
jgi:hypothetical protein